LFQALFEERGREMRREEVRVEDHLFQTSTPVTSIGEKPDFPHPSPEPDLEEEAEDTVLLSWKQFLRLLTRWDPLIRYSTWLRHIHLTMDHTPKAHKMLAMWQPERNILKDLRRILLAADTDIPSTRLETNKNNASLRYVTRYDLFH